jgi:hypothetical protein
VTKKFSQVRLDIIDALDRERHRLSRSKTRHSIETTNRILTLDTMLGHLKTEGQPCVMRIERELKPWEIQL